MRNEFAAYRLRAILGQFQVVFIAALIVGMADDIGLGLWILFQKIGDHADSL